MLLGHRHVIEYILILAVFNTIFHFIDNYLVSRLQLSPFTVFIEDTCRFLNPSDTAHSVKSSLKITRSNDFDAKIVTMNFLLLGFSIIP